MKKIFFAVLALMTLFVSSCNKEPVDPIYVGDGLVTFRPMTDGKYYLKVSENQAFVVTNPDLQKYPFDDGKEHRALIRFGYDPKHPGTSSIPGYKETMEVNLFQADTILTKKPLVYDITKEAVYGNAQIGLYLADELFPRTCIEDGYLNVFAAMPFGMKSVTHVLNLLTGVDPEDPYTVELRHNMNGDNYIETSDVMYCFPLQSLPDTEGKTVKLTLRWNSLATGEMESTQFDYCTRTDW